MRGCGARRVAAGERRRLTDSSLTSVGRNRSQAQGRACLRPGWNVQKGNPVLIYSID
jgi:hypothetical protein